MSNVYSFNDYDKNHSLKVSTELLVIILYLMQPYFIWLSSLGLGGKRLGSGAKRGIPG